MNSHQRRVNRRLAARTLYKINEVFKAYYGSPIAGLVHESIVFGPWTNNQGVEDQEGDKE